MAQKNEAPEKEPDGDDSHEEVAGISQWEFIDRAPTRADTIGLLETMPDCFGARYVDYADYVQALPQNKKIKVQHPTNPNVMIDKRIECYTLYMSVAGRIRMANDIADVHGWTFDMEPEPHTPTNLPGYLQFDDQRFVYREYAQFTASTSDGEIRSLGRKPGTAWVPASGGRQAAGSNPFEKVETSARGRAIAAWGIGVLPGSGVASVEEMQSARQNQRAIDAEQATETERGRLRMSREDLIQDVLAAGEEFRQASGASEADTLDRMGEYLGGKLGISNVRTDEGGIDWDRVKDGQVRLLATKMRERAQELRRGESL